MSDETKDNVATNLQFAVAGLRKDVEGLRHMVMALADALGLTVVKDLLAPVNQDRLMVIRKEMPLESKASETPKKS